MASPTASPTWHRIEGRSMAPTLWGTHVEVTCDACQYTWKVDGETALDASHVCPHCGQSIGIDSGSLPIGPDVVELHAAEDLTIGKLVAIRQDDRLHVKRIVALPGNQVSLDRWRLLVNGTRIEDRIDSAAVDVPVGEIVVDDDSKRSQSRWLNVAGVSSWTRDPARRWKNSDDKQWLHYQHRNVHDNNRPSPIQDDYPGNVDLQRALFPVDRLSVSGTAISDGPSEVTVAFWSEQGNRMTVLPVDGQTTFRVTFADANEASDLPVTAEQPLAIRASRTGIVLAHLLVKRHVEYRLRPGDDASVYPLTVPHDSIFVLGDNVPVSIDSRNFGPIPMSSVVGVVTRR